MSKILIVGLGIGKLYYDILSKDHEIVTVDIDPTKKADYQTVDLLDQRFDLSIICTPNFTHKELAYKLALISNMILIEKPGLETSNEWKTLLDTFPTVRFMMAKNNQYRDEIEQMKVLTKTAQLISINWNNCDRIPYPGSWFTNKKLAWGGVSRDLIPHLLSIYVKLFQCDFPYDHGLLKKWSLSDLKITSYGSIKMDGIYDVDDQAYVRFRNNDKTIFLSADWKTNESNDIAMHFHNELGDFEIPLGLCPEYAYENMIKAMFINQYNDDFWHEQQKIDVWIHEIIERLTEWK